MLHKSLEEFAYALKVWINKPRQIRLIVLTLLSLCLFAIVIAKLYSLQIVSGEQYANDFSVKTERTVSKAGARGNIYDANGNLLAYNKLSYNVTIADNGAYSGDYNERNLMLYRLASILEKHSVPITSAFYVKLNDDGTMEYTTKSDTSRRRFIANVYGISSSLLDTEVKYSSDMTAEEAFQKKVSDYKFDSIKGPGNEPVLPSQETMLDMVKILFTMRQTAFQRYETTTIAVDIDEYCMAELLENQAELKGVSVDESYQRKYNNAKYFSHIIGYTGAIQDEAQLQELKKYNSEYEISDIVGATGIEKSMETELQGKKGFQRIHVDSYGQVLDVMEKTDPKAGNDIYLTIDQNLQIGIYHLLETQMAAILGNKIVNMPASDIELPESASDITISIDDAYYQLINNNVLDNKHFAASDAGKGEKEIYNTFRRHKAAALSKLSYELLSGNSSRMNQLTNEYVAMMAYIYDLLSEKGIIEEEKIDQYGETYLSWKNDTISLKDMIYNGISEGWINTSSIPRDDQSAYTDSDTIYNGIMELVLDSIQNDSAFDKIIYKYMIINYEITGRQLCMSLYEQEILEADSELYAALDAGDNEYAYSFFIDRVLDIDITPAQLALDPCMGSVVVTDVNTGDVLALVTYPGYDNNRITERDYFNECMEDLSLPLINSATQTNKAPGSTFKPISAIAVLEEGKCDEWETVDCTGVYEEVTPNIKCWIGRPGHGSLTVRQAIENSCNYCFADYGHRLSMERDPQTGEEIYNQQLGIEKITKYASMFGLDRTSGIEIEERAPSISKDSPEWSAFGQASHSFNNVQLARYTTALANTGKLYDLTLLKKETDSEGELLKEFDAEVVDNISISGNTWDQVHAGLRDVVTVGAAKAAFVGWNTVQIAGKTGTAEEVKTRGNHGYFISYAPYNDPQIAVTVTIPFSYSSGNSARLARRVYDYYYGATDLPAIINENAREIGIINITDG